MEKKVTVVKEFADPNDFSKRYKVGDELKGLDESCITYYTSLGIVEVEQDLDSGDDSGLSDNWKTVVSQIKEMTDMNELLERYKKENEREKPRNSVLTAIEERIKFLESQDKQ